MRGTLISRERAQAFGLRVCAASAAACCVALLGVSAASATSPARFRAQLNALCRTYTPKFKAAETAITKAQSAEDPLAYYAGFGRFFSLVLTEDSSIEIAVPPAPLKAVMARSVGALKSADPVLRAGVHAAGVYDAKGVASTVKKMNAVGGSINRSLDAAGLRDCGSNQ